MAKKKEAKRMCINCSNTDINGKGLFCVLIPDCPIKMEDIRYSCPEHKFFSESHAR